MSPEWSTAIAMMLSAISTIIIRRGSKSETGGLEKKIKDLKDDLALARSELAELSREVEIFKTAYFEQNPKRVDHRSPK